VEQRYIEQLKIDIENRAKKAKEKKEQGILKSNEVDLVFFEGLIDEVNYMNTTNEIDYRE
jgi:hypothetical protein